MADTLTGRFSDRHDAGRRLAARLGRLAGDDPLVLGVARGGVPVAFEVAQALGATLDLLVVAKVGAPGNPEFGIGAVAEGGTCVIDAGAVAQLGITAEQLQSELVRAATKLDARVAHYRGGRPAPAMTGRTVVVVDDGLATGGSARAALRAVRAHHPRRLVLAVPVGAHDTVQSLGDEADEIVCVIEPEPMVAVGLWYEHFEPTSDAEIAALLSGPCAPAADAARGSAI